MMAISWTEGGTAAHYAVTLLSAPARETFDPATDTGKIFGQFALVKRINDATYEAMRDPLGIGKLFYTEPGNGEVVFADRFTELFRYKTKIYSLPAGKVVRIGAGGRRELVRDLGSVEIINQGLGLASLQNGALDQAGLHFQKTLAERLDRAFSLYRTLEESGWKFFIALSGGLDSSIIATAAVRHLANPVACTLDLGRSEDAEKSALIAQQLGIRHLTFPAGEDEILAALDQAPLLCQDFRDFNVHCAALNLLLAENIHAWVDTNVPQFGSRIIVLTGDLMNEYTCDYAEEKIGDSVYYKLPKIGSKELQRYLIRGLDTSDRELLPFRHYGLNCIQPYAIVYDLYANLSEQVLQAENVKKRLNSFLVPEEIRQFIPKSKLRAQVGSKEHMGILGLCHRAGITDRSFRDKLLEQSGGDQEQLPIFVGKYDVEKFS